MQPVLVKHIQLKVNGQQHTVTVEPETPLLFVLNDELGLQAPKFGCCMARLKPFRCSVIRVA